MNITFDVDGVLANFSKGFCGVLKDLYDIDLDPDGCKSWHWADWADGLTHEMETAAWEILMSDPKYASFWTDLDPLCTPAEVGRINTLSKQNIVSFVTNRSPREQHKFVALATKIWLCNQGFMTSENTFLATHGDKGVWGRRLGTHLAIEDNGDNCVSYLDHGIGVVMLRRAYNEAYVELLRARGGYIVDTLDEFLDLCFRLDAGQDDALKMSDTMRMQSVAWNYGRSTVGEPTNEPSTA
jgi:hypothetical protein